LASRLYAPQRQVPVKPRPSSGDNDGMIEFFTCNSCNQSWPRTGAMDRDRNGDFLEDTCPDCYWIILGEENLIPNAAEAQRMEEARAAIATWRRS
jgi:hypothetical protein